MRLTNLFLFMAFLHSLASKSQEPNESLPMENLVSYEKLYLHIDRDFYFQGDSIWFKAYSVEARTQKLVPGQQNLFVDLLDKEGRAIDKKVFLLSHGTASGNLSIPNTIKNGNYIVRAFTDSQKKLGEETFFHRSVRISRIKNPIETDKQTDVIEKGAIAVSFLAEGGILLADQVNVVGIKAIGANGLGVSVKGKIIDSKGLSVSTFETRYKGMGKLHFLPQKGESYTAVIENYPDYRYQFNEIRDDVIKLEFTRKKNDELLFRITSNTDRYIGKTFHLAMMHRGVASFHVDFVLKKRTQLLKIQYSSLTAGINRFVLMDEEFVPISERLMFLPDLNINKLAVKLKEDQFNTRSKVQLEIVDGDGIADDEFSNLSVAVINANAFGTNGVQENILSWLLLKSELKGHIESPANFFIDDDKINSQEKLDLLMLTQGWSKYLWNTIKEDNNSRGLPKTAGVLISGKVKKLFSKAPVAEGSVTLGIFKDGFSKIVYGKTDENGRFLFDNIFFTDTVSVFLQGRNAKGRKSTEVILDPGFKEVPNITAKTLRRLHYSTDIPVQLYEQRYHSYLKELEFDPEIGSIILDEVEVKGNKKEEDDGHFRIYGSANNSIKITEEDNSYTDIFEFLKGRIAGVIIMGNTIKLGGIMSFNGDSTPLFLIDGMSVMGSSEDRISTVRSIPISSIDKVEILKDPGEIAMFGSEGSKGVIAIYTKMGKGRVAIPPKGVVTDKIIGYSAMRKFYSPEYTVKNSASSMPDHRITLHWEPNVITKEGKAVLNFFTSDDLSGFILFVEGITSEGRICLGSTQFVVDEINEHKQ